MMILVLNGFLILVLNGANLSLQGSSHRVRNYRSIRLQIKNLTNFTGKKHVLKSLFNKFAYCNILKKRLLHRCFPVKFVKFLRTAFFYRASPVAASGIIIHSVFL